MKVIIAPNYGKEIYHTRECTGLNQVKETEERELSELPDEYSECPVCDKGSGAHGNQRWSIQNAARKADVEDIDAFN